MRTFRKKELCMIETLGTLEDGILLFIQDSVRNSVLTPFFVFVTRLGDRGFIWIVFSLLLLLSPKTRKTGCMGLLALLLSLLVNNLFLKNFVGRSRPFDAIQALMPLIPGPHDFSFPSGHTASSFAAAGVFFRRLPGRLGVPAIILAALIAVSRLYVGVHYPTDVLFGMLSGLVLSFAAQEMVDALSRARGPRG